MKQDEGSMKIFKICFYCLLALGGHLFSSENISRESKHKDQEFQIEQPLMSDGSDMFSYSDVTLASDFF